MSEHNTTENASGPISPFGLQDIFDNAPIGIFTSTPEGRYISANPALARMFGYDSPEELITSVTDISKQIYAEPEERKVFTRMLETHDEVINHECRFRRRDGTKFWFSSNARAVKVKDGHIIAYQGFMTNITERKFAESKERESEQRFRMFQLLSDHKITTKSRTQGHSCRKRSSGFGSNRPTGFRSCFDGHPDAGDERRRSHQGHPLIH